MQPRSRLLLSVFVCLSTAVPVSAETLLVGDCPNGYPTIQTAVNAAQPGDKILVCPGIYAESVLVEVSDLRIEAQAAPGEVIVQGTAAKQYGFQLRGTSGVVVEGFTVQGFAQANIIIEGGSGNTLRKNVTTGGLIDGIEVIKSTGNLVEKNISFDNKGPRSDGIFARESPDNTFRHNETFGNGFHGINLLQSPGSVLFGNRAYRNAVRGMQAAGGSHNAVIENNRAFENGLVPIIPPPAGFAIGILVVNSNGVTVKGNRSEGNGGNGIALNTATETVVTLNHSEGNLVGIVLNGAAGNLVDRNQVAGNVEDGIRLQNNADGNAVQENDVQGNGRDGIRVVGTAPDNNTIERNAIRDSAEHDAHDDSAGPGTGGSANFWIDNNCETENRPGLCGH